ncbi:MAG: hypothetical protein R3264_09390, partial [Anaerolineae bacterium]|nr:hypothetical protein [Anaerolineae bacterium]
GTFNGERWMNVKRPQSYIHQIEAGSHFGVARDESSTECIDRETAMAEHMLLGLRLVREGVSAAEFESRFDVSLADHFAIPIEYGLARNLLEWGDLGDDRRLRLTHQGRFLANQVIVQFV